MLTLEPPNVVNEVTMPYGVIGNMTDSDSVVFGSSPDRAALGEKSSDIYKYAKVAQLAERQFSKLNVAGSTPVFRSDSMQTL